MINTEKLKGRIVEKKKTIQSIAPKTGYSAYTLGKMISNKSDMSINTSIIIMEELEIPIEEVVDFFYV